MKQKTFIITGPSASGKTTLAKALMERLPKLTRFVTTTTRLPRLEEVEGRDYHFITQAAFKQGIKNGEFFEWDKHYNNFYGSSKLKFKEFIKNNSLGILVIDPTGARTIKKLIPEVITIFIKPDSINELGKRLRADGRNIDHLEIRLASAQEEIFQSHTHDYQVINQEGKLNKTVDQIIQILNEA